jgi:phosphoglycolate phosphatase-like HAD superfamily hydrolase
VVAPVPEPRGTERVRRVVQALDVIGSSQLGEAYRRTPPVPIPGVPEMFRTLRRAGVKIALQTGYAAPVANSIMTSLGWTVGETVDALVTSDTVAASRPAPYLIFHAMEATGAGPTARRRPAAGHGG